MPSIAADELLSLPELEERYLANPQQNPAAVVLDDDGRPAAGILTQWYAESNVLLLSYLGNPEDRLRFYARAGFRLLPVPYFQPALRPGSGRVHGMLLTCSHSAGTVRVSTVVQFLDEYFRVTEGEQSHRDPGYRRLRAAVQQAGAAHDGELPLWPLEQFKDVPPLTAPSPVVRR